jgi:hypothetical protein
MIFRRVVNAFVVSFLAVFLPAFAAILTGFSSALVAGDADLRLFAVTLAALVVASVAAGIRALQSFVTVVPSPEPEENVASGPVAT